MSNVCKQFSIEPEVEEMFDQLEEMIKRKFQQEGDIEKTVATTVSLL